MQDGCTPPKFSRSKQDNYSPKKLGIDGSGYETIFGNLDTPFRIQRNHSAIQQRQKLFTENIVLGPFSSTSLPTI
jgi:hypothetical protein